MSKRKLIVFGAAAAVLIVAIGAFVLFRPAEDAAKPAAGAPIAGKAVVNIDGMIDEVAADGHSFRTGDLWVYVDENTQYGISEPTGAPAGEQLVSREFQVGNAVSGFTQDDLTGGKVYAVRIYNNFAPQQEQGK